MIPVYIACFITGLICVYLTDPKNVKDDTLRLISVVMCQIYLFMTVFGFSGILWTIQQLVKG